MLESKNKFNIQLHQQKNELDKEISSLNNKIFEDEGIINNLKLQINSLKKVFINIYRIIFKYQIQMIHHYIHHHHYHINILK